MKTIVISLFLAIASMQLVFAQSPKAITTASSQEQEISALSKDKWAWMSEKNVDKLTTLFDDQSMFVHIGGSWGKSQELEVIKSGNIWYKKATVYSTNFHQVDNTAILLSDLDLVAVVGGNEPGRRAVNNPFMVTEVFVNQNGKWSLGQPHRRPGLVFSADETRKKLANCL